MVRLTTHILAVLGLAMALILALPGAPRAQKAPPTVIAVIDMKRIGQDAKVTRDIRVQSDRFKEELLAEATSAEEKLRAEGEELKRQRSILSPEAFGEKRRDFDRRASEMQRYLVDRERTLKQSFDVARSQVVREIISIVSELSKTKRYNMVLRRAQVEFFSSDTMDITDDVISALDKRLPRVVVPSPKK